VYIWNGTHENNSKRDKRGYEYFEGTCHLSFPV
jgi:hypothetical protein